MYKNKQKFILIYTKKLDFFLFFFLFRAAPWHMEVPRVGTESELQLLAYATATWDQALSATYTTPQGNARCPTHWAKPGIEPMS